MINTSQLEWLGFLEKNEPRKDDDDFGLLMTASDLLRGRGGLDFFLHY